MNRFATIFTNFENIHLTKDVGMIPMEVSRLNGFDVSSIFFWEDPRKNYDNAAKSQFVKLKSIKSRYKIFFYLKFAKN